MMEKKKYVLATNNEGKLRELRAILSGLGIEVLSLKQVGVKSNPDETGASFLENALIKAREAMNATGLPVIADDSGLEVAALEGKPGVYSARYGAPEAKTDLDRNNKLLEELKHVPAGGRNARFVCVAACAFPDGRILTSRGECAGQILFEAKGTGGFGYDPIFCTDEYGMTMAEMPGNLKNRISHRSKAITGLLKQIAPELNLEA
jgi:XTP/dITP diphosphohydrolase